MRRTYKEKIYRCGDYIEVQVFPVFKRADGRRRKKSKPTSEMQAKLNQKNAERELTRLLNANFTERDISLTLTFRDEWLPESVEEAERLVKNFIRRLKRLRQRLGLGELRYIVIPGPGRFHFHIPMSGGVDIKELQEMWPYGYANAIHFELDENGLEGHARYIAKQFEADQYGGEDLLSLLGVDETTGEVFDTSSDSQASHLPLEGKARAKGKRRYSCSRNIIRPEAEEKEGRISAARVEELATFDNGSREIYEKLYPGYSLSYCRPYYNEENGGYYLEIKMYKKDADFMSRKKRMKKYERKNN